jgi:branched-chain amino acid transport system ATP-binding protein
MEAEKPSLGLAPLLVQDIFNIVNRINEAGVTVLLVEQNVRKTMGMCHRAYVLENGRIVLEVPGCELLENAKVKEAFAGDLREILPALFFHDGERQSCAQVTDDGHQRNKR